MDLLSRLIIVISLCVIQLLSSTTVNCWLATWRKETLDLDLRQTSSTSFWETLASNMQLMPCFVFPEWSRRISVSHIFFTVGPRFWKGLACRLRRVFRGVYGFKPQLKFYFLLLENLNCRKMLPNSMQIPKSKPSEFFMAALLRKMHLFSKAYL